MIVEMELARHRALTRNFMCLLIISQSSRNGVSPPQGIDTKTRRWQDAVYCRVEMELARRRALTHVYVPPSGLGPHFVEMELARHRALTQGFY